MKRQAWRTPKAGVIGHLRLIEEELPPLATGLVRVRVRAVGLNFADVFALTGLYSATPKGEFTPGLEFAGEIIDSADPDSALSIGMRVMGCIRFGAYASIIDVPAKQLTALPSQWSYEQGAAFLVQTFTAWYALRELGAVKPGQLALIQSAAGGVGLQALQLCKALKVAMIGTVGDTTKQQWLAERGWSDIVVRDAQFRERLRGAIGDRELLLVLDGVGGQTQKDAFDALAPCGRLVVFGAAEFTPGKQRPNWLKIAWRYWQRPRYDVLNMISANKSVMAFNLIWLWQKHELFAAMIAELTQLELDAPFVGHAFAFNDALDAIECLRSGKSIGKVVLKLAE